MKENKENEGGKQIPVMVTLMIMMMKERETIAPLYAIDKL